MQISVDTKHDSPDEIRKLIQLLSTLIEQQEQKPVKNIFDDNAVPPSSVFGSMFDAKQDKPKDSILEVKDTDRIEIIPY